ncbi:phosphatidylserine decarboxylase [Rhizophagus clarus]|uniref:Phosphatidylserine decarboxylase n=1 Tax=Rhizophagus clarus TaxID=94130 RepID=A0A8H3KXG9_9GLOM|nr:phosphatidylserine decarboxylase [Rhizophagus clarus]
MINNNEGWKLNFTTAVSDAHNTGTIEMANINNLVDYYNFLNYLVLWVPSEDITGTIIYRMLCTMYLVLDQKTVIGYQTLPTDPIDKPLSELSIWMINFANELGKFLNTTQSLTKETLQTFYTAQNFDVDSYVVPKGGWIGHTFNEFFAREFLPGTRPIDGPNDPHVIVSAADSTFQVHTQHAPVDGEILEAKIIPGLVYLEVNVTSANCCEEPRIASTRKTNDCTTIVDAPNSAGYQFRQSRGLFVFNSTIGLVAVLPIGMAQVSSVVISDNIKPGVNVKKGDEISYFQFGGSDIVYVFQKDSDVAVTANLNKHYRIGEQIAIAKPNEIPSVPIP